MNHLRTGIGINNRLDGARLLPQHSAYETCKSTITNRKQSYEENRQTNYELLMVWESEEASKEHPTSNDAIDVLLRMIDQLMSGSDRQNPPGCPSCRLYTRTVDTHTITYSKQKILLSMRDSPDAYRGSARELSPPRPFKGTKNAHLTMLGLEGAPRSERADRKLLPCETAQRGAGGGAGGAGGAVAAVIARISECAVRNVNFVSKAELHSLRVLRIIHRVVQLSMVSTQSVLLTLAVLHYLPQPIGEQPAARTALRKYLTSPRRVRAPSADLEGTQLKLLFLHS
ncbi:hypothetical protein EVAR_14707_1 [Eumeta japonica]|uniref:Uncharacterized protein n=1 Tax=Eumeta variegata TaxID=151549 RepID=A0A4C1U2H8_EUMVA|nr:hypothetical protein EVAR_14707_1 [Eumeta japonica]